jgi:hypothetical protein
MKWLYLFLGLGAALAVLRVFMILRRQQNTQAEDWDAQLVKNYRAQGGQGFQPVPIEFFFGVPEFASCQPLAEALKADGAEVDYREATTEGALGYTLHASKQLRVSVTEMQEHSRRYRALAAQHGASYDGWATTGVTKYAVPDQRLKPKRIIP